MGFSNWKAPARALALLALIPGCGEVSLPATDGGVDAPPVDPCLGDVALDDAWSCLVTEACTLLARCLGNSMTVEECEAANLTLYDMPVGYAEALTRNALEQGTLAYDSTAAGQCMESLRALSCEGLFRDGDPVATCGMFVGTVPDGGSCFLDLECGAAGGSCIQALCDEGVCCAGTCQYPAPLGGTCADRPCAPGSYCVNGVCANGAVGTQCNGDYQCQSSAWCDTALATCQADRGEGEVCTSDTQCASPFRCVGRRLDGATSGTCLRNSGSGDPCDGFCGSYYTHWCDQAEPSVLGVCRERSGAGESCNPERSSCEVTLYCDPALQVCMDSGQAGDPCPEPAGCDTFAGLFCTTELDGRPEGVCELRRPNGAACSSDYHCQGNYCKDGLCTAVDGCYP